MISQKPRVDTEQNKLQDKIAEELKDDGYFGTPPATVVIVSGSQPGVAGMTNRITIRTIQ